MSKKSTAIITAIAITVTGSAYLAGSNGVLLKLYNKIVSNNSKADDTNKTASPIVDNTNKYRNDIMDKVYCFVDDMNSTKVVTSNGKKIMFNFDEGMAFYLFANANQMSPIDLCNLYGDYKVNYIDVRTAYESATNKFTFYCGNSKYISSLATLIGKDKDNVFLSKFEELQIKYNQATSKQEKAAIAESIREAINANFGVQIDAPYTHINQGVSRLILDCMIMSNEVGVVGLSDKNKDDLKDISLSLCQTTNEMVKELINNFNNILTKRDIQKLDANANDNIQYNDENSYENLRSKLIGKLAADGHYPSEGFSFDSDITSNYGESQQVGSARVKSRTTSSKVGTKNGTIVWNKKVVQSGKNLTEAEMNKVIDSLPDDLKKEAQAEKDNALKNVPSTAIKKEEVNITEKNSSTADDIAQGALKGDADSYGFAWGCAYARKPKPAHITIADLPAVIRSKSDLFQQNYVEAYNNGIDTGYAKGLSERAATDAKNKASDVIIPDTNSNPSNIPQGPAPIIPTPPSNGSTPNGGSQIQIDPEYEDKIDGPIYDKNGHIINTSFNGNELNQLRQLRMAYVNAIVTAQVKAYYRDKANEGTVKVYRQA